jgi:Putative beta-barrel porin-2, OmpL-like. bbp2
MTGPLQLSPSVSFEAGPLGKLNLNGVVSGTGLFQSNPVPGNNTTQWSINNGELMLQKTDGWWRFYLQAGAYNLLSVGAPYISTQRAIDGLYGPVPVGFLTLAPTEGFTIQIGQFPTLMGAEYTFDFENMNVERGLLWTQENAITRGIQVSQTLGKFTVIFSWNDGYYSNRYSWLSGSLNYTSGAHTISFIGMGNLSHTAYQTLATPVQNNGSMYSVMYTYNKGSWIVQPYFQVGNVPTNPAVGVADGASAWGGAILVNHTFKHGFSLPFRWEYLATTGSLSEQSVNLLYGPGSAGLSLTVTPTYQHKHLFTRGDVSWVRAMDYTPGSAFGPQGTSRDQVRGVIELGFLF